MPNLTPHPPVPWVLKEQGEANQYCILTPDGRWVIGLLHNGEPLPAQQLANLRFIVHAVNTHEVILSALRHLLADAIEMGMAESEFSGVVIEARNALALVDQVAHV